MRALTIVLLTAVLTSWGLTAPLPASPSPAPEATQTEVEKANARFLHAFENLDMPAFIRCFAEDATVFFPVPEPPQRFDGKEAVRAHFEQVFAAIRKSSSSSAPPYHQLVPQDLAVQVIAPDAAVVSFTLRNAERIARRTLVFKKINGDWLILHLHASNVSSPASQK